MNVILGPSLHGARCTIQHTWCRRHATQRQQSFDMSNQAFQIKCLSKWDGCHPASDRRLHTIRCTSRRFKYCPHRSSIERGKGLPASSISDHSKVKLHVTL